jgi:hypothetical protein
MNIEDVTNIDELIEFMTAEAALWGRTESDQSIVNGAGIAGQRSKAEAAGKFPAQLYFMAVTDHGIDTEFNDGRKRL